MTDTVDHGRAQLSACKVPHSFHVVGEMRRTGSGKIIRFRLKGIAAG